MEVILIQPTGGTGVNNNLPPMINNFYAQSGNETVTLTWNIPTGDDAVYYEGLDIVRKVGSMPTKVSDGVKIKKSKTDTSHEDTGLVNGTEYYYRAFPYNAKKQYQTMVDGAVASCVPLQGTPLSELPVGTLVKDVNSTFYDTPVIWKIADKNHTGYPDDSVTLITEKIITVRCSDAKESSNTDSNRKNYGNNRHIYSNIRQWLNSEASAGNWYTAQHSADAPPTNANVWDNNNEYDAQAGFLNTFSDDFVNALLETTLTVVKATIDGGGSETFTDKIFLASTTEVGLANESNTAEGALLALFSDNASRLAKLTSQAVSNSEYTDSGFNANSNWYWLLRTPYASHSYYVLSVFSGGTLNSGYAYDGRRGVRPLCNLSGSQTVQVMPDDDGVYILNF